MTERSHARLVVLAALVMSLVFTLVARSAWLQLFGGEAARSAAASNRDRELRIPAARGLILDQRGRTLASNRLSIIVEVSRAEIRRQDDDGDQTFARLGELLGEEPEKFKDRSRNCGTPGAVPQPNCWNGPSGADPVVARDLSVEQAGAMMADPARFPGLRVREEPIRHYPGLGLAAHLIGHLGAVTAEDLAKDPALTGTQELGRAGLETKYENALRGRPGLERVILDSAGNRVAAEVVTPAIAGAVLVTTIDAKLQSVVEGALAEAIDSARARVDRNTGRPYAADGGAAVVLDVRTGAVLAMASAPTFDANIWSGGIATSDYRKLTERGSGEPLVNRALTAALPPASTFKVVSAAAALSSGYSTQASYPCPASYRAGGRDFRNYGNRGHGWISLRRALELSCDTVFYRFAHQQWRADGGSMPVDRPIERLTAAGQDFGFGLRTGIDLPGESSGRLASRQGKQVLWEQRKDQWCARAKQGYPEVVDRKRAAYLKGLARENCADGMLWRVGDALNAAIGQGETSATVLQVANAYAAIANGGTLWQPRVGQALLGPSGSLESNFPPVVTGRLDVSASDLRFLRGALRGVVENGTAKGRFSGFPLSTVPIAGKTGTAEVFGKQTTSWFASFAPADQPRYAVVMMVEQGGTGAGTAGRGVRKIYEALFGVRGARADPERSVLVGADVATSLPTIGSGGIPQAPAEAVAP